ncbi:unnamed protein product [Urochloa humidicola]
MSPDVGWELLCKTMNISRETEVQHLKELGMEIIRMCGGLPLAIKVIASVLATKDKTMNQWRMVIDKSVWSMSNNLPIDLQGALYLSYDDLPKYLKRCFLYCAIYPEDFTMSRDDLIRYWVAEGLVEEQGTQLLEDTAEEYYYELMHRNILQPDPTYFDYYRCTMHDLLWQLARHLLGEECFCGDPQSLESKDLSKLRRVSIILDKDFIMPPSIEKEKVGVRTFSTFRGKGSKVDNTIFQRVPRTRVLNLTGSRIHGGIPDYIGNLIHLRLLDLDGTNISCLPESIRYLQNLQVLNLQRCFLLRNLPSGITQLCNLRRLGLLETPIIQVPKGIGKLGFLNDLQGFPVGGCTGNETSTGMQDGWSLEELRQLSHLRKLDMNKLERATPCSMEFFLINKQYLKVLNLQWTERVGLYSEDDVGNIEKTLTQLVPPHNIEDIVIKGYIGWSFPTWLQTSTHLSSLKYLELIYCGSCAHLPPIGQLPNLKGLVIQGAAAVTKIGPEFLGYSVGNSRSTEEVAFPMLENLVIQDMHNLEDWTFVVVVEVEEATAAGKKWGANGVSAKKKRDASPTPRMQLMPRLKQLQLECCPMLRALPRQLGQEATSLKELQLSEMHSLKVVENFLFLSELLIVYCPRLERVSNLPQARMMHAQLCKNLSCVERLDNLHELFLTEDMQDISSQWLPGLQEQHRQLHGEDLDVYTWQ